MRILVPSWSIRYSDNPSVVPLSPISIVWDHGSPYIWQLPNSIEPQVQHLHLDNERELPGNIEWPLQSGQDRIPSFPCQG